MKIELESGDSALAHADLIILPVGVATRKPQSVRSGKANGFPDDVRSIAATLDKQLDGQFSRKLKELALRFEPGERAVLYLLRTTGRFVGSTVEVRIHNIAIDKKVEPASVSDGWRKIGADAAQSAKAVRPKQVAIVLPKDVRAKPEAALQSIVEGLRLGRYRFERYKARSAAKTSKAVKKGWTVTICGVAESKQNLDAVKLGEIASAATMYTRDLVNIGPSDLPPIKIVAEARKIAAASKGRIKLKVYGRAALKQMKAGALLGVSLGSELEPFLLHLTFRPRKQSSNRGQIALVGKGVTFDSGGLSIKTGQGMMEMKCDMAGAAAVLAVMRALIDIDRITALQHEVHVVVPTTENMINGLSLKPGDVVQALNGKTIEVLNTDAEGRLILADALSYLQSIKPDVVIDIATLTGACVVALGTEYAGLFSNSAKLTEAILECGQRAGDRWWEMPLAKEYRPHLDSSVAQLKNISTSSGPGAIIGAIFLQEFVPESCAWAHLDIAGPAFNGRGTELSPAGGTGFGVRTLLRTVLALNSLKQSEIEGMKD